MTLEVALKGPCASPKPGSAQKATAHAPRRALPRRRRPPALVFDIDDIPSVGDLVHTAYIKNEEMARGGGRCLLNMLHQRRLWTALQTSFSDIARAESLAFQPVVSEDFLNGATVKPRPVAATTASEVATKTKAEKRTGSS